MTSLALTWSKNCALTSKPYREEVVGNNSVVGTNYQTNAKFEASDTKLYAPVVTVQTESVKKTIKTIKNYYKVLNNWNNLERTIKWNKYISEMGNQTKTNNLNS